MYEKLIQTVRLEEDGISTATTSQYMYKPYGGIFWEMEATVGYEKEENLLKWIGKEKDNESSLGDHGVRKYEYETGIFTSVDPLWDKYYGFSPYQYSLNNPISLFDNGGEVVKAMDEASQENIRNSVEAEYRDLVQFNDDGTAYLSEQPKVAPLKDGNHSNIEGLRQLINHDDVIEVSQSSTYQYLDYGMEDTGHLDLYTGQGKFKGLNGVTLAGKFSTNFYRTSTTENHQVVISPNQDTGLTGPATKGSTTAHELYGHLLRLLNGLEWLGHEGKVGDAIERVEENANE